MLLGILIVISVIVTLLMLLFLIRVCLGITVTKYIQTIGQDEITTGFVTVMCVMLFLINFIGTAATYNTWIR